ncbi:MAG TPA: alanine racemase [Anaerolineales bacterium]|nr:alanine racemase [Anaerolineales bacterium]
MPPNPPRPTYVVVDLSAIQHNLRRMEQITHTPVMAVVKANAYGHGAVEVSRAAIEAGVKWLGVAFASEGLALRQAGLKTNILVLGYTPPNLAGEAIENDLSLAVYDLDVARAYGKSARALNRRARLHVKVDTGMGRLGAMPGEAVSLVKAIENLDGVTAEGLFTHFATADESDQSFAFEQLRRFLHVVVPLEEEGREPKLIHAANSAAALVLPEARFDLVRVGIAMYGLHPSPDVPVPDDFIPALEWKSTVSQVKTLPPGTHVSYGREYVTKSSERIAVIPVGYADGFRRFPKNVAQVIVGGQRVPVVGRVCMDQIMASVSAVDGVKIGDEVVLIGRQGGARITAEDAAAWWGTINYDVTSGVMARVPRVHVG